MKLGRKKLIIFLATLSGAIILIWSILHLPPKVVNYSPHTDGYFFTIRITLSKKVLPDDLKLEISPSLQTKLTILSDKKFNWQILEMPQQATTYHITLYYRNKLLKKWQVKTPNQPLGGGTYTPQFEEELQNRLQESYLLQHLPKPNNYYGVKYYNEKYIAIYIFRQPEKAKQLALKWLATLPPTVRMHLKVDWVE